MDTLLYPCPGLHYNPSHLFADTAGACAECHNEGWKTDQAPKV